MGICLSTTEKFNNKVKKSPSTLSIQSPINESPLLLDKNDDITHHYCPTFCPIRKSYMRPRGEICLSGSSTFYDLHGRKYFDDLNMNYYLPCDDQENDRQNIEHFLWKELWGTNFMAPIHLELAKNEARVLDIGCGSGAWILEMASTYVGSNFIGLDIAPCQPHEIKPYNATFINVNFLERLPFQKNHFDLVHQRSILRTLTENQFINHMIPELLRITKSGGFIELVETEIEYKNPGPLLDALTSALSKFLQEKGFNCIFRQAINQLEETGKLKGIHKESRSVPIGKTANKLGKIVADNERELWHSMGPYLAPLLNLTTDLYDQLVSIIFTTEIKEYSTCIKINRFYASKK
ncbi:hypothetical protein G9A89_010033 [Geosiphon pyriformis]|nr:hypothetical protein G9A89_010033 [Geosiphon pyriformis]